LFAEIANIWHEFYTFAQNFDMKKLVLLSAIIFSFVNLDAQINSNQTSVPLKLESREAIGQIKITSQVALDSGKVEIQEDLNIGVLIQKYNSTKKDIGYRIQIHSGLARIEAINAQSNFLKLYPDVPTYLIYQQPNFKIRVGDFESRIDVLKFHEEMMDVFPGSFVIKDDIIANFN
jgi:hypothetical protein